MKGALKKVVPRSLWNALAFGTKLNRYFQEENGYRALFDERLPEFWLRILPDVYIVPPDSALLNYYWRIMAYGPEGRSENCDFRDLVSGRKSFMDIGASAGWFSALFARLNSGSHIVSVEPDPQSFDLLQQVRERNLTEKTDWQVVQCAVSDAPGRASFNLAEIGGELAPLRQEAVGQVETNIETLPALFEQFGVPEVLKMDIEGFEFKAFPPAIPWLTKNRTRVHLEIHWFRFPQLGWDGSVLAEALRAAQPEVLYPHGLDVNGLVELARKDRLTRIGLQF